ncbi:MAG: hypothetical protein GX596_02905 [Propionibacterium sp.]|nr:hypothetical protein [Propionibacterium sp.]
MPSIPQDGRWRLALRGLRTWGPRQVATATIATVIVALVIGVATVLIPNPVFGRDIPPVWWNYPVWLLTSLMSGMLIATFVRSDDAVTGPSAREATRTGRLGTAGGVLAWFAVGCPVCNKIALLALGYSGAITWFAPIQPLLAVGALLLTTWALVVRLQGLVACSVPVR